MKESWDECSVAVQAKLLAFDQTMQHDENERDATLSGARTPFGGAPPSKPPYKPPRQKKGRSSGA